MKINFKQWKSNLKKWLVANATKINAVKSFLLLILGYGLLINYACAILFNLPFKWYGFPAFGLAYYFIVEEFVAFFRKLRAKTQ